MTREDHLWPLLDHGPIGIRILKKRFLGLSKILKDFSYDLSLIFVDCRYGTSSYWDGVARETLISQCRTAFLAKDSMSKKDFRLQAVQLAQQTATRTGRPFVNPSSSSMTRLRQSIGATIEPGYMTCFFLHFFEFT